MVQMIKKITNYSTRLDEERLQPFDLVCLEGQDYLFNKDKLKESLILNYNMYKYNWMHIDDFSDRVSCCEERPHSVNDDNLEQGIDLNLEKKWSFESNHPTGQSLQHYTYAICQRMISISPDGIVSF